MADVDNTALLVGGIVTGGIVQLVTFLTLVFNTYAARKTAERNRQWELEDRKVLAAHVATTSQALADKVMRTSEDLAFTVSQTTAGLAAAIHENTALTGEAKAAAREAYQEANHANAKIALLTETAGRAAAAAALSAVARNRRGDDPSSE